MYACMREYLCMCLCVYVCLFISLSAMLNSVTSLKSANYNRLSWIMLWSVQLWYKCDGRLLRLGFVSAKEETDPVLVELCDVKQCVTAWEYCVLALHLPIKKQTPERLCYEILCSVSVRLLRLGVVSANKQPDPRKVELWDAVQCVLMSLLGLGVLSAHEKTDPWHVELCDVLCVTV